MLDEGVGRARIPYMARELSIGDEVAITATITRIIDGRASIVIPTYNFPHSIAAPPKAKANDPIELTGEVRRVDDDSVTVHLSLGGTVTLSPNVVRLEAKYMPPKRKTPLVDKPT